MASYYGKSCVFSLFAFFAFSSTTAVVVVQDDGYQNILVTFAPDIEKDDQYRLLFETKDLMTIASNVVYKATGIHFGEVILLLPYTWGKLESWSSVENIAYSSPNEVYYDANIFIENSKDTVYGTQPYTLQKGGCGREGVRITIPIDFLNSDGSIENERAKVVAREWIRYRYGVFYENGYPNDERYPLYYGHPGSGDPADIHVTGCTDKPVNYTFKNSAGSECPLTVDVTGRAVGDSVECRLHPEENGNNSDVVLSSLMYLQDLPSVVHLCDDTDHIHDADAPNKQNSLCNGRSIWNVMSDHPDFKNRRKSGGTSTFPQPKFKIVMDRNPRIVVAIDGSTSTDDKIKQIVTKTTQKFVYDLPDETELALFFFGPDIEPKIPFGLLQNRLLLSMVFSESGDPCLRCAFEEGLKMLNDGSRTEGTIVLMSSTDSLDGTADLVEKLTSSQICLIVIFYGTNLSDKGLQELLNASPCSHLWIMPSVDKEHADLDALIKLNELFELIIKNHSYHNANYTIETVPIFSKDPVSFQTDQSIKDFGIRLTGMKTDLEKVLDDSYAKLKNSRGDNIEFERTETFAGFRTYQVSNETGDRWDFRIEKLDESGLPILFQVVAKESNSESLRLRSWVENIIPSEESANSEQLPVILYVEVAMGRNPVLGAEVRANIVRPDGTEFRMQLLDNGLGDPDVTKYDGIYSRYFTQFTSEGEYKVTININDNGMRSEKARPPQSGPSVPCCGSFVPNGPNENTGPFTRVISTNFRASSGRPAGGYKPLRVQDLHLYSLNDSMGLTFQWTSPGGEMGAGSAQEYIFKLFETRERARNFENEIIGAFRITDLVTPLDYAQEETVQIQLSENLTHDKDYFFAMRSVSRGGRQSDTSNVVEIVIPATIPSPPPTEEITGTDDNDNNRKSRLARSDGKIIGIVVGVCVLVIIICICAYIAFYLVVVKGRRQRDQDEVSSKPPRKESREPNEDNEDEIEGRNERQMKSDSISPVNSWPSNVLVNHHEKVKEAKRKNEKPPVFTLENLENSSGEINTISNGLLPNPIYSSYAEMLNDNQDNEMHATLQHIQDHDVRPNRRVTHV